jgi:23S rRNA pseudouridine1911/1915/1917 synthase
MSESPINGILPQAENLPLHNRVLYTDNHLIAINKLPGEIVQGDKTGDQPLSEVVAVYLKALMNKPGDAFIGVIHRIDRPVSGLVLFARTGKGLSRLNAQFRDRKVKKTYFALVEGKVGSAEGHLVNFLAKNEATNTSRVVQDSKPGALRCELSYKVIEVFDRYTLLEINPVTGRHHQIRVQLSAAGWPIKGDVKYGARRGNKDKSICLHARTLHFEKASAPEQVIVTAPLPGTPDWLGLKF